jgi:hypothetical protein
MRSAFAGSTSSSLARSSWHYGEVPPFLLPHDILGANALTVTIAVLFRPNWMGQLSRHAPLAYPAGSVRPDPGKLPKAPISVH